MHNFGPRHTRRCVWPAATAVLLLLAVLTSFAPCSLVSANEIMPSKAMPSKVIPSKAMQNKDAKNAPLKFAFASWNLAEATPYISDCEFIKKFEDDDVVVLGVQECEDLRPRSTEGRRSLAWNVLQKHTLGPDFVRVKKLRMGGVQQSVFARRGVAREIQGVRSVCVPCGFGNVMVNKGAVCTVIKIRNSTIAMVNAHLAAHEPALERRNADYARIRDSIISRIPVSSWGGKDSRNSKDTPATHSSSKRRNNKFGNKIRTRRLPSAVQYGERSRAVLASPRSDWSSSISQSSSSIAQSLLNMDKSTLDLTIGDAYRTSKPAAAASVPGSRNSRGSARMAEGQGAWPFDATFFIGDLNYRVRYPSGKKVIVLLIISVVVHYNLYYRFLF
jgi:hypothetical protein